MKNNAIILIVLAMIFITGCTAQLKPKDSNQNDVLLFKDITYNINSEGFDISGRLTTPRNDSEGIILKLFCKNKNVASITSGANGEFEIKNFCKSGDEVYVQAIYHGKVYESKHRILTHGFLQGLIRHSQNKPISGVPEFSIITITLAIFATTIGLIYLRKT